MANNLTKSQKFAIEHLDGNLLVSASAGSGKTFVMIERVKRLILEGLASVDSILAVTYTKLAAEEMKEKLVKSLIKEINSGNNVEMFKQQLRLIPLSSISTFHSFCGNLLRSYFYAIEIGRAPV